MVRGLFALTSLTLGYLAFRFSGALPLWSRYLLALAVIGVVGFALEMIRMRTTRAHPGR